MKKISAKRKVKSEVTFENNKKLTINAPMHCIGTNPSSSGNGCSEVTRHSTSVLSWLERSDIWVKVVGVFILNFVHSSVSQNGSSTRLAANMNSSHVTNHGTLELWVFKTLMHISSVFVWAWNWAKKLLVEFSEKNYRENTGFWEVLSFPGSHFFTSPPNC